MHPTERAISIYSSCTVVSVSIGEYRLSGPACSISLHHSSVHVGTCFKHVAVPVQVHIAYHNSVDEMTVMWMTPRRSCVLAVLLV